MFELTTIGMMQGHFLQGSLASAHMNAATASSPTLNHLQPACVTTTMAAACVTTTISPDGGTAAA